ncbi:unnamed protein product [Amoebophrya sp. A25]|nr:unnamed protein product [Amoebophrya sp. A25]|eukprot:GSA25T00001360001.1
MRSAPSSSSSVAIGLLQHACRGLENQIGNVAAAARAFQHSTPSSSSGGYLRQNCAPRGGIFRSSQICFGSGQRPGQPGQKWEVFHPPVREDIRTVSPQAEKDLSKVRVGGFAKYIPKNFQLRSQMEAVRSGEFLGPDYPYNFLGMPMWGHRRYNVSYHDIPIDESGEIGVVYQAKRDVWQVQWHERGRHRQRVFRAQFSFTEAKYKAEAFRKMLESTGRVDNCMTARHRAVLEDQKEKMHKLKKKLLGREAHIRIFGKHGNTLRGKWAHRPKGEEPGLKKKHGAHYPKW